MCESFKMSQPQKRGKLLTDFDLYQYEAVVLS